MRRQIKINNAAIRPSGKTVARGLGIPKSKAPDERTQALINEAIDQLGSLVSPQGLLMDIDAGDFERVYHGDGMKDKQTPVDLIAPKATSFALYAVTLGDRVSREISRLFGANDFAAGAALDAAASESAELAAQEIERQYAQTIGGAASLPFSPGYCGWHVSAQTVLFEILQPEEVGISLTPSCLMEPLKSISGVIIAGAKEIFEFEDNFPFCDTCLDRSCRTRLATLAGQ